MEHGVTRVYFIGGRFTGRKSRPDGSPPKPLNLK